LARNPAPFKIIKDHVKNVRGIYVDGDYLYTWGPGYVPEGSSYPLDTVFIYDKLKSFEMDGMLVGFGQDIYCVTSNDRFIVVGGGGGKDLTGYRYSVLRLYNKETQLLEQDWGGDEYRVTSLFADEKYVYASTSDSMLIVYDKPTMREIKTIYDIVERSPETPIASDDSRFYFGSRDGKVQACNKVTFAYESSLMVDGGEITHMIAKDGFVYIASARGNIIAWNPATKAVTANVQACDRGVRGMTFVDRYLITGDTSGTISGWDTRGFQKALSFATEKGIITALRADDRFIYASKDDGTVIIWNISDVLKSNQS
jgi:WD40 repeat protein